MLIDKITITYPTKVGPLVDPISIKSTENVVVLVVVVVVVVAVLVVVVVVVVKWYWW